MKRKYKLIKKLSNKKRKEQIREILKNIYGKPLLDDTIKYVLEKEKIERENTDILNKKIKIYGFDDFDDFILKEFELLQCLLNFDVIEKILDKKFQNLKTFVLDNVNNYEIRKEVFNQYSDKDMNDFKVIDYLIQMYCHFKFTSFENQVFHSKFMKENHFPDLDKIKGNDDIYLIKE